MRINHILTDNGKEFTDRLFGLRKRAATGAHEFDRLCADLDIEHRLTLIMDETHIARIESILRESILAVTEIL